MQSQPTQANEEDRERPLKRGDSHSFQVFHDEQFTVQKKKELQVGGTSRKAIRSLNVFVAANCRPDTTQLKTEGPQHMHHSELSKTHSNMPSVAAEDPFVRELR
jgi:hypothetical protein